jgi:hypothetical protein
MLSLFLNTQPGVLQMTIPFFFLAVVPMCAKKLYLLYKNRVLRFSPIKNTEDIAYEYYQRIKDRYSQTFEGSENYDANVDSVFYVKDEYNNVIKSENNYLEKEWRTRILIETCPRGNVIMYYDPYKMGFCYYSDTTAIPYNILNAIAMKYVLTFYCRAFFVDNKISHYFKKNDIITDPTLYDSPLIPIHYIEEKPRKTVKKTSSITIHTSNNPFIKAKNYGKNQARYIQPIGQLVGLQQKTSLKDKFQMFVLTFKQTTNKWWNYFWTTAGIKPTPKKSALLENRLPAEPEKEYNCNRFIHMGKISNFNLLQKPLKTSCLNGFESKLLENLKSETKLQKDVLNYKNYKISKQE